MGAWRFWWAGTRRFYQHWGSYVALIFGTNLVISYLAIPFFNWALEMLLKSQGVAYVSYTNFGNIIVKHPLAALGMLVILLAIIILVYWQFAFLLLGITNILNGRLKTVRAVMQETIQSLHDTSISTFIFFIGYFIVILPFGSYLFTTPLLNKAKIPAFIVSFLLEKPWMAVALVVFYLVVGYLGLRLMTLLPLMIIDQLPWRVAVKQSWQQSRHRVWRYFWHSIIILGMVTVLVTVIYAALYLAQLYFDTTNFGMAAATVNLFIMEVITEIIICYTTAIFMMLIIASYRQDLSLPSADQLHFNEAPRLRRLTRSGVVIGLTLVSGLLVVFNLVYLNGLAISKPLMISHRGVDDGNGVQNTIPALIKTSREKPDYVEMDIQVTKDHKFVVMHDTRLKNLAGINKKPSQLTLKQLQKITVRENGHQAKIPSFDQYLNAAIKHHQKLLVEIKTSSAYRRQDTKNFIKWYGKKLLANHEQVHTLSYKVMNDLKTLDSKQFVSYIMPYNLTFPYTKANGYTMEVTTLNDQFVDKADRHHKTVYAWDIDDTDQMDQMMFMGVTGIITDNLHEMQAEAKSNTDHPGYAKLLLTFMNELSLTSND
ncbi:glycerophosphoryl diester phosphodiesterase membrane domain-containing protein [Lactiplantibacillus mudanjiangensis]|uniref:Glycerophosphodiester phosphodiesterase [Lactobacillus plantarum subsp. plantarum ST-III] n=1 Tax=Lactiplantibacillus mudanjiangensis TaxID=1296538 RepID=A0A660DYI6_9LACO|nr:glycerophosphodiester phosphodiesterase [Lactiplantibacillus mudanjiangensis]VDG18471.1 glycerophosphodiester phosphodiesterase [Lactobacillus plantarum subsp. plantarum ST-III] [Lactiplantibacillus mudanjiangensis]VDG25936.1 glycerophosphodiester phosphodiesterase [Lactobacillus plantarum subsp. plantarum ST-III] [Lactiplantibacillus mudanjiangensis]VDG28840.1 glycerophosphodiester phosphodiesterase [Lactobacillus plantarum subsp. plantarum ST-III] [Lactiplantibacillus mudanjiangensis]